MVTCPSCNTENIDGDDHCEGCGQPLNHTHLQPPASAVERSLLQDRVGVLNPKSPITVPASTAVGDVLRLMVQNNIGCVLITHGNRPIGIFSERDALRKLNTQVAQLNSRPVSDFMTPDPQTLVDNAKVAHAVQRMDLGGYRHLPIVSQNDDLVGIISARDILCYLANRMKG